MDPKTPPSAYDFGEFRADPQRRMLLLKASGRPLPLTSKGFDLLLFFVEHPGVVLDKSRLMGAVWPNVVVEENNLNQHVSTLRRLLGERLGERRYIVTVPGRGYQFIAAVQPVIPSGGDSPPEDLGSPGAAAQHSAQMPVSPPPGALEPDETNVAEASAPPIGSQTSRNRWALWALSVAVLLVAGAAWYAVPRIASLHRSARPTSIEVVAVRRPRVAVLPFENLSPDPSVLSR